VTLLFPFASVAVVDEPLRAELRAHFASFRAFDAELDAVGCFDGHVWLSPQPRGRFVELIDATCTRFPAFPPYGGEFTEPVPHLTIGAATTGVPVDEIARAAEAELAPVLRCASERTPRGCSSSRKTGPG